MYIKKESEFVHKHNFLLFHSLTLTLPMIIVTGFSSEFWYASRKELPNSLKNVTFNVVLQKFVDVILWNYVHKILL